jgi:hypothetical protein
LAGGFKFIPVQDVSHKRRIFQRGFCEVHRQPFLSVHFPLDRYKVKISVQFPAVFPFLRPIQLPPAPHALMLPRNVENLRSGRSSKAPNVIHPAVKTLMVWEASQNPVMLPEVGND